MFSGIHSVGVHFHRRQVEVSRLIPQSSLEERRTALLTNLNLPSTTIMFSARLSLAQRWSMTAARQQRAFVGSSPHKATPLLKRSPPNNLAVGISRNLSTTTPKTSSGFTSQSSGGGFFQRNKLLLQQGAVGTVGVLAYTMQQDKADWQEAALAVEYFVIDGRGMTIEECIERRRDYDSALAKAQDLSWYDIGFSFYRSYKTIITLQNATQELFDSEEITFPELLELLGRDDVRAFKINTNFDNSVAEVQYKTRHHNSNETPRYHFKIEEGSPFGAHGLTGLESWVHLAVALGYRGRATFFYSTCVLITKRDENKGTR